MNSLRRQPRSLHTATAGKKVSHALVNLVRVCRRKKRRTQRNLKSPMVLVEGGGSSRTTILNMSHYLNALNNTMVVHTTLYGHIIGYVFDSYREARDLQAFLWENISFYILYWCFEGHAQSTNDISSANTKVVHVKPIDRTFKDLVRHP
ncbi:uncharacterized protein LOC127261086 isoform X2 [Andrographis paniculata]|uniref:uncharacterized protein LOC127261086 isoform X2 n=1 Tax=Andrographis paniculata TaxID=175694 RepID=UPI0021E70E94|nr:uncharacterized protein LOC127261086 isoform X2 [Andrographis paniculata]